VKPKANFVLSVKSSWARIGAAVLLGAALVASGYSKTLTLPPAKRPAWLQRDGIVMAGSWEPLLFRVRRDGSHGYEPTPEQLAAYAREHSPEMVAQLKALGVNFVMTHAYKGFGLGAERQGMADAVRFAQLCHDGGLHVGVYSFSGAFGWELFYHEHPEARDWVVLDQSGKPVVYESAQYRYFWNRNHPDAQSFYKGLVRFAVREVRADLIHFDNYNVGPGFDACSVQRFRKYLGKAFTSRELRIMGSGDLNRVFPPNADSGDNLQKRAWLDFCCQSLADSYHDLARYARTQRKDILVECNPGGPGCRIQPPVDHGRLLTGGEAFWDEEVTPGYRDGVLRTRIRTFKLGRSLGNLAFAYTTTPLAAAEAMAFNLDCLGCVCWFEYGELVAKPGSERPVSTNLAPYIRFFTSRRDLFRNAQAVADVAILRSFASQVYAGPKWAQLAGDAEQALIENRVPFQIIYDQQMTELHRYRVLVLAGCIALSDPEIKRLRNYVASGGRLCIIGPLATHDEWLRPRSKPVLPDLPSARVARFRESGDCVAAVRQACGGRLSLCVEAPPGLCAELTEQAGRRLVHLVNYRSDAPVTNAGINLLLPPGKTAQAVRLTDPEHAQSIELAFEQRSDCISFSVPRINVYEVAVIEFR
jgi:hypothetical protein